MRPAARYIAAGVVAAALGVAPALAQTPTTDPSSAPPQGTQGTPTTGTPPDTSTTQGTQPSSGTTSPSAGVDEAAAREHLSQARQALAELTKLPAAAQLQGEQRTAVASLIQAFNGLATATSDWRSKFKTVSDQLDQILGTDPASAGATGTSGASATSGSASTGAAPSGAPSSAGAASGDATGTGAAGAAAGAAGASYDPSIIAKLREVRTHLDGFQEASGDPTPHFDAIDQIVDAALNGGASASVGTSGSAASATGTTGDSSAGGGVSITRAQLEEIKEHVAKLRAAAEAAAARKN